MQRLRLSHTKPRLSVMIRNWQCQRISRQTRDLDKSSIVIRLSLFSTNCHFLVWLPLSWAPQEMVYRPLGWAQVCENQKLIIDILRVRAVMIITDHQEAGSWMGWQCVSPDRRCNTTLCYDIHCCPSQERNSSPSAGSRHDPRILLLPLPRPVTRIVRTHSVESNKMCRDDPGSRDPSL